MTAEVAVLNRLAVALAADSAATVGRGDATKIFQNENKLFELSETKPVGLMIYNATQFFGIPWEIIIKDFRRDKGETRCAKLFDWVDAFKSYVMHRFPPTEEAQRAFVRRRFDEEFGAVFKDFVNRIEPFLTQRYKRSHAEEYKRRFNGAIDEVLQSYDEWAPAEIVSRDEAVDYLAFYSQEYQAAYDTHFGRLPLEDDDKAKVTNLAIQVLKGAKPGDYTTGLVFAGFGDGEVFPSLQCVEINGVVANRLRSAEMERADIDRAGSTAEVIPFAQCDTADSLMHGRSARYERQAVEHFSEVVPQVGEALVDHLVKGEAKRKDYKKRIEKAANAAMDRFVREVAPKIGRELSKDILDIVRHMPKQELATFAESLVTVSSIKRKVTVGPERVGGPVDVAVISRHEGFVWVRRKYYFTRELNLRYVWRAFGGKEEGNANEEEWGRRCAR